MILIDLGNTNAKIFKADQVIKIASCEIFDYLDSYKNQKVLISSVVPSLTDRIKCAYPTVEFIESDMYHLMFDSAEQLASKGADRVIAAFGAVKLWGPRVVVCDIGTCVTLDVVADRRYISGLIYPGFVMLENLLNDKIEQLPKPEAGSGCVNTANQIYWANLYGFIGALSNMIEQSMSSGFQLVITGGSVLKLKEEYGLDILEELAKYRPIYSRELIKIGMEAYIKEKTTEK